MFVFPLFFLSLMYIPEHNLRAQAVDGSAVSQAELWRLERTRLDQLALEREVEITEAANEGLQHVLCSIGIYIRVHVCVCVYKYVFFV
jgi:hypothetical protein